MGATGGQEDGRGDQHAGDARYAGGRVRQHGAAELGVRRRCDRRQDGRARVQGEHDGGHRSAADREGHRPQSEREYLY